MTNQTQDAEPAFPLNELNHVTGDICEQHFGLTVRDYFIAHAPAEPQDWFEPRMPTARPELPKLPPMNELPEAERKKYGYVMEYRDLLRSEELSECPTLLAFVERYRTVQKDVLAWNAEARKQRQVQWPAAWADEMLKARQA